MNQFFSTGEMDLAAALETVGFTHSHTSRDPRDHNRCLFSFPSNDDLLKAVQAWWQRSLTGNLNLYAERLKFLKAKSRNDKKTGQGEALTD